MGHNCCTKQKVKRGLWSPDEDEKLVRQITAHGHTCWSSVPKLAGLQRCGKSCRLRWINYLRPDVKRGSFTDAEERTIIDAHRMLGNRWAQIAKHLPGRTDNEVKNFWNSRIRKKLIARGLDPNTHNLLSSSSSTNSFSVAAVSTNVPDQNLTLSAALEEFARSCSGTSTVFHSPDILQLDRRDKCSMVDWGWIAPPTDQQSQIVIDRDDRRLIFNSPREKEEYTFDFVDDQLLDSALIMPAPPLVYNSCSMYFSMDHDQIAWD